MSRHTHLVRWQNRQGHWFSVTGHYIACCELYQTLRSLAESETIVEVTMALIRTTLKA